MPDRIYTMEHRNWIILAGALGAYLLLMFTNPIRSSLLDGFRCVRRYQTLWSVLALFGFCYAAFQLALRVFFHFALPEETRPIFQWHRAWFLPEGLYGQLLRHSLLPAAENVAGIFNNLIATYPFSVVAALMLLTNWEGHLGTLRSALIKRFQRKGFLFYLAICICALAAIAKPFLYCLLPFLNSSSKDFQLLALQVFSVIDWLSFLFEYLFGVCIQLYLILLVYAWLRGLTFTHQHMLDFAIRRFGSVVKWAVLVMVVSSLAINIPLILSNFPRIAERIDPENVLQYVDHIARPLLAGFLLLFATVQITLTFHSESVWRALGDHLRFLRKHWLSMSLFLLIAGVHFLALNYANVLVRQGLGEGTAIVIAWQLAFPLIEAFIAGWMLASWVCLFKRCEAGRIGVDNWIQF